jgi:hypothetical protein
MQDASFVHFDDDDQSSFDDLDALFNHLERFEPPADMVERIMDAVAKLPPPHLLAQDPFNANGLIGQNDNK